MASFSDPAVADWKRIIAAQQAETERLQGEIAHLDDQIQTLLRENEMQQAKIERLRAALGQLNDWLVCAAIASAEDMAQSFECMQQIAGGALTSDGNR